MSDTVIRVENLGKKYIIGHQQQERYTALRDVITNKVKSLGSLINPKAKSENPAFEEFWALKDVSFDIKQGDRVGIIGRNGAGKSTLLKILSRITEPTTGSIKIKGRVASLLEVGTGFHPELTGRENIFLNGAILGMGKEEIKRKFDEIVAFAEVEKFLDTPVKRYSSGMYVRLAFAVAAHLEPEILIVDEVLAVGDVQFQKKCFGKMEDVGKEGRTVIFVSHNMPTIQALCQRAIWLQKGSVQIDDKSEKVISSYLTIGLNLAEAEVDLTSHPRRNNSQESAIKRIWLLNSEGLKKNVILMGSKVSIYIEFKLSRSFKNPAFGFGIEDEYGKRIFSLNNYMKPTSSPTTNIISGIACLTINSLPLLPGSYFITPSIAENQHTLIDFVEQAISIEVQPYDIYNSGKIPEKSQGIIFIDGEINLFPTEKINDSQ
jgi:lipopolysaccharide transport system ATP-binding protein